MSLVLELTPDQAEALSRGAARAGMDVPEFLLARALEAVNREESDAAFLTREATRAVTEAQNVLLEKGIGYVTGDETDVHRHRASPADSA